MSLNEVDSIRQEVRSESHNPDTSEVLVNATCENDKGGAPHLVGVASSHEVDETPLLSIAITPMTYNTVPFRLSIAIGLITLRTTLLNELDDLIAEVKPYLYATLPDLPIDFGGRPRTYISEFRRPSAWVSQDRLYCPACAKDRKVEIKILVHTGPLTRLARNKPKSTKQFIDSSEYGPSLLVFTCKQCELKLNCFILDESFDAKQITKMMLFPSKAGGLSTLHTPAEVKHFVDEAYKCQNVGANGAAVEMYRVALEQLLHEQGYETGLLNAKIKTLEEERASGKAKPWAMDLDIDMLHVLRKLGNQVAHPNNDAALSAIDVNALIGVQEIFQFLLADIYERPKDEEELLSSLIEMQKRTVGD